MLPVPYRPGSYLPDYAITGVDFDGCFAEYIRIPAVNLWLNRAQLPPEIACLQDPLGQCRPRRAIRSRHREDRPDSPGAAPSASLLSAWPGLQEQPAFMLRISTITG